MGSSTMRQTRSFKKQKLEPKLRMLNLANNNFEQDLSFLAELTELEELSLANNKFFGSLEPLKNITKLRKLDISGTDISEGLEYLPESCEEVNCSLGAREDAKVKSISQALENYKSGETDSGGSLINAKNVKVELLCEAAEKNEVEKVKRLLERDRSIVDSLDKNNNTALHYAVSNESWETIEILL